MELVQPRKQKVWGWPGVINFSLGGMAAAYYLLISLLALLRDSHSIAQPAWLKLLAPALTCLGFLALTTEAGHPLRGRHLLRYLRSSWMSRETLAGAIFVLTALLDWLFPHPALWALAAAAAMGLTISHGFILYRARAVTAWNVPWMPLLFVASSLVMGGGLALLVSSSADFAPEYGPAAIGLACVGLGLAAWILYLRQPASVAFRQATWALRRPASLLLTVGAGHLLPGLLLLVPLVAAPGTGLWRAIAALSGLVMIIGGASQKAGIVLKADYLRGIELAGVQSDARGAHPVFPLSLPAVPQRRRAE